MKCFKLIGENIYLRTCIVTELLKCLCQFDLRLNLSSELLHLPQVLHHLSPDNLYDGRGEGQPQEDVDGADYHVETLV